ncbi:MAG: Rieske 2Fe-2S domain-containing protein [Rhodothermaceae bacterium]
MQNEKIKITSPVKSIFTYVNQAPVLTEDKYEIQGNLLVVDLANADLLASAGDSVLIENDMLEKKILVARTSSSEFSVIAGYCTHRNKALKYDPYQNNFCCSSLGNTRFDPEGNPSGFLTKKSVKSYDYEIANNSLIINLY